MARELLTDLVTGVGLARALHLDCAHDDARNAEATLNGKFVNEGLLNRVKRAVRLLDALDGEDVLALCPVREVEAGVGCHAVDEDGARTALADLAATLGAREVKPVAQRVEQRLARVVANLHRLAVDGALENAHCH